MNAQRDLSAHRLSVRSVGSVVGAGRLFHQHSAVGHLTVSLPLPEQLDFLAAHTGAVF